MNDLIKTKKSTVLNPFTPFEKIEAPTPKLLTDPLVYLNPQRKLKKTEESCTVSVGGSTVSFGRKNFKISRPIYDSIIKIKEIATGLEFNHFDFSILGNDFFKDMKKLTRLQIRDCIKLALTYCYETKYHHKIESISLKTLRVDNCFIDSMLLTPSLTRNLGEKPLAEEALFKDCDFSNCNIRSFAHLFKKITFDNPQNMEVHIMCDLQEYIFKASHLTFKNTQTRAIFLFLLIHDYEPADKKYSSQATHLSFVNCSVEICDFPLDAVKKQIVNLSIENCNCKHLEANRLFRDNTKLEELKIVNSTDIRITTDCLASMSNLKVLITDLPEEYYANLSPKVKIKRV